LKYKHVFGEDLQTMKICISGKFLYMIQGDIGRASSTHKLTVTSPMIPNNIISVIIAHVRVNLMTSGSSINSLIPRAVSQFVL